MAVPMGEELTVVVTLRWCSVALMASAQLLPLAAATPMPQYLATDGVGVVDETLTVMVPDTVGVTDTVVVCAPLAMVKAWLAGLVDKPVKLKLPPLTPPV